MAEGQEDRELIGTIAKTWIDGQIDILLTADIAKPLRQGDQIVLTTIDGVQVHARVRLHSVNGDVSSIRIETLQFRGNVQRVVKTEVNGV